MSAPKKRKLEEVAVAIDGGEGEELTTNPTSSLMIEDFPLSYSNFSSLTEEHRSQVLLKLADTFTPSEKMRYLERVKSHISGDFLSLLPPELVEEVLSYLTAEDLLHGMQVCRSWYQLIVEAVAPWKAAAKKMGISESLIEENRPKYGSMSALTLAALRHRKRISSSVIKWIPIPGIDQEEEWLFVYAGQGITLYHTTECEEFKVDIKSVGGDGTCTLLKSITGLDIDLEPCLAFALDDGAVMWMCGKLDAWIMCNTENDDNRVIVWETEPLDIDYEEVAVCLHCGLVVIIPSNETRRQWELRTLKLIRSSETSSKVSHQLRLPDSFSLNQKYIRAIVLPNQHAEKDDEGFCKSHSLVLGLDDGIVFYNFPEAGISDPVKVLRPQDEHSLGGSERAFALSHDKKLAGMITSNQKFHIWRLDSDEYAYHILPAPIYIWPNSSCFAVGHLYSVLNCGDTVKVVVTFTGEEILSCHNTGDKDNVYPVDLWGPADVTWLNDFSYYPKSGVWHLTALSYADTEDDIYGCRAISLVACT